MRGGRCLRGRAVEPGSGALVFVDGFHGTGAGAADDGFALDGAGVAFGLNVAGRDGEDEVVGGVDDLVLAVFVDHAGEGGLGGFELFHLGLVLIVGGFDVDVVGLVDDGFGGDDEGVAEGDFVGLDGVLEGQKEKGGGQEVGEVHCCSLSWVVGQ